MSRAHQTARNTFRFRLICSMILGTLTLSCWLVFWPAWQRSKAVHDLRTSLQSGIMVEVEHPVRILRDRDDLKTARTLIDIAAKNQDAKVRRRAAHALAQVGPDSLQQLVGMMSDKDPLVRLTCTAALGSFESKATAAVPALIQAMQDPDQLVRLNAVCALGRLGPAAKESVPDLIKLYQSRGIASDAVEESLLRIDPLKASSLGIRPRQAMPAPAKK